MTFLEWASAGTTFAGQAISGDRGVVVAFPGGALVAVIDGLGHGTEACEAALAAERVLLATPSAPLSELVRQCHERLRGTRGAVLSLASFDERRHTMSWLGVGNVEGFLVRGPEDGPCEAVATRGGTVGYMLPPLHPRTLEVQPGDTLVFATDGVRHGFKAEVLLARSPQQIADAIVRNWSRATDDAYVIVARYTGEHASTQVGVEHDTRDEAVR